LKLSAKWDNNVSCLSIGEQKWDDFNEFSELAIALVLAREEVIVFFQRYNGLSTNLSAITVVGV
jgi:hypothetical protein